MEVLNMMPIVGQTQISPVVVANGGLLSNPIFIAVTLVIMIPVGLFLGVIYTFLLRKLTARFQWRVGPIVTMYKDLAPLLGRSRIWQPLYDILKLFGKDNMSPRSSRKAIFLASPYLAFICAFAALFFIPLPGLQLLSNVSESLVITAYLLILTVMFTILGAASSGSPWSAIGARREVEIFLIYEIGLVVSLFSVAMIASSITGTETLTIWGIVNSTNLPMLILDPFAAILLFLVMLGKLAIKPFDIAEAESEIVAGPFTEYSGRSLGLFQLAKVFLLYDLVTLFLAIFLAPLFSLPVGNSLWFIAAIPVYVILAVVMIFLLTVVQVLHPRYKISKAISSYGTMMIVVAILAVAMIIVLNYLGVITLATI
jgi:NADH-quinone oxidoreductase subunit H